jgi:hypothetical protein
MLMNHPGIFDFLMNRMIIIIIMTRRLFLVLYNEKHTGLLFPRKCTAVLLASKLERNWNNCSQKQSTSFCFGSMLRKMQTRVVPWRSVFGVNARTITVTSLLLLQFCGSEMSSIVCDFKDTAKRNARVANSKQNNQTTKKVNGSLFLRIRTDDT